MKVLVRGKEYKLWFQHEIRNYRVDRRMSSPPLPVDRGFTECRIYRGEEIIGGAGAWCSLGDNFEKKVGRKISLARALDEAGFSREDRAEIWRQYFEVVGR